MALSILSALLFLLSVSTFLVASSFTLSPQSDCSRRTCTKLALFPVSMPVADTTIATTLSVVHHQVHHEQQLQSQSLLTTVNPLQDGVTNYMTTMSTSTDSLLLSPSSSLQLSLKDRVIPTEEEIAAKKLNFNIIFWGGGFVAPLIATVFYFGFRFWEK